MRRLPTLSMSPSATTVNRKLLEAIANDANVGFLKPTSLNIVAEKYMSELCNSCKSCVSSGRQYLQSRRAVEVPGAGTQLSVLCNCGLR